MKKCLSLLFRILYLLFQPKGKISFLVKNKGDGCILDVGCGNDSVKKIKRVKPNNYYIGVDVDDYNLSKKSKKLMDEYHIFDPEEFDKKLLYFKNSADYVVSANNLEHCYRPYEVLENIVKCTKNGGYIFLSFPSEDSLEFPSREGTLNFYDDPTHINIIEVDKIYNIFEKNGVKCIYFAKNNKPLLLKLIGYINEKRSKAINKICRGTWEYWGFETIIWGKKDQFVKR